MLRLALSGFLRTVLLAGAVTAAPLASNAFYIHLHGVITEYFTGDAMKGVQVRLVKDSVDRETVFTAGNGKYELYLERGYDYQVWFYRADMVTKHVRIDAREIPLFPDVPFYDMDLQISLFAWVDGMDYELFSSPIGLAEYKHSVRNLNWDVEYTDRNRRFVDRFMVQYERLIVGKAKEKAKAIKKRRRKAVFF